MTDTEYNGWPSRDAWNFALWTDGNFDIYSARIKRSHALAVIDKRWTPDRVAHWLHYYLPTTPDGYRAERLTPCDLEALAEAWNEELEDDLND